MMRPLHSWNETVSAVRDIFITGRTLKRAVLRVSEYTDMKSGDMMVADVDLSCSRDLEKLEVKCSKLRKLNLSRCDNLKELTLLCNLELTHVSVSNRSSLRTLKLIDTPLLSEKCLEYLDRALERNGGSKEVGSDLEID